MGKMSENGDMVSGIDQDELRKGFGRLSDSVPALSVEMSELSETSELSGAHEDP